MVWSDGWSFNVTNVSHRRGFSQFIDFVRNNLGVGGVVMQDARRLPPFQDNPQFQDLELSAGERTVVLRLRTDNLYVVGFRTADGRWFRFRNERSIPGIKSEPLSITGSYVGSAGLGGLDSLHLSSDAVATAVSRLAIYDGSFTEELKTWLRTLIVSFVESSRFTTVAATVATAMGGTQQVLSSRLIGQIHNWSGLSGAVLRAANRSDQNPDTYIFPQFNEVCEIRTASVAAAVLGLITRRTPKGAGQSLMQTEQQHSFSIAAPAAESDDADYGITLLEVLSVVIANIDGKNPGNLYGTVLVRDSFGTVDLFNRESTHAQSVRPGKAAELRWPGRAISADDDFVIELNLMDQDDLSPDDEVSRGEVLWVSGNALSSESDVVSKVLVKGTFGSAEVSYAVLTNAVVATMEVLLIDGDGESKPEVYGTITAAILKGPEGNLLDYDLFKRARSDPIGVRQNENIPLLRRVITAIRGLPLIVKVDLWDKDSLSSDDQIASGSVSFQFQPPQFKYTDAEQITGRFGRVKVCVTWSLSHEQM